MDERTLTWASLLARWMAFARSAVALPADGEGARWRDSVAPAITLQAVTLALRDLLSIPLAERPLARDRAELLVRDACAALDAAWRGEPMPESIADLRHEAQCALDGAEWAGAVELFWPGPGERVVPILVDPAALEPEGTLCVAAPGTILMAGEPVAWWVGRSGVALDGCVVREVLVPRQVYRVLDHEGRVQRDVVAPLHEDLPAGLPLLVPLLDRGRPVGSFERSAAAWESLQRAAMPKGEIPVQHLGVDAGPTS
ncbi:MAG: hypothetical protein KDA22_11040 [Phycisphaerales bacterium]|nr:hypothetical protein [Phycisphaerales bacterium]